MIESTGFNQLSAFQFCWNIFERLNDRWNASLFTAMNYSYIWHLKWLSLSYELWNWSFIKSFLWLLIVGTYSWHYFMIILHSIEIIHIHFHKFFVFLSKNSHWVSNQNINDITFFIDYTYQSYKIFLLLS